MEYLSTKKVKRFRLALATKPYDIFFLCHVPTQNMENAYYDQASQACHTAKEYWVEVVSRKAEGIDGYKIDFARDQDAFPVPNWPKRSLNDDHGHLRRSDDRSS